MYCSTTREMATPPRLPKKAPREISQLPPLIQKKKRKEKKKGKRKEKKEIHIQKKMMMQIQKKEKILNMRHAFHFEP